jgi:hypothetical protein
MKKITIRIMACKGTESMLIDKKEEEWESIPDRIVSIG